MTDALKKKKAMLALVLFVCIQIAVVYVYRLRSDKSPPLDHSKERPEGFPEVLMAPDNALEVVYTKPSGPSAFAGVCALSFRVREDFPAKETLAFIALRLKARGWRKLRFDLFNPHWPLKGEAEPLTGEDGTPIGKYVKEYWLHPGGRFVGITASHGHKQMYDPDYVYMYVALYDKDSWVRDHIDTYRLVHPEVFRAEGSNAPSPH